MCPNPQFPAYLVAFTEEILPGKLHFSEVSFMKMSTVRFSGQTKKTEMSSVSTVFCFISEVKTRKQKRSQNPHKHLRWRILRK